MQGVDEPVALGEDAKNVENEDNRVDCCGFLLFCPRSWLAAHQQPGEGAVPTASRVSSGDGQDRYAAVVTPSSRGHFLTAGLGTVYT